MTKYMQFMSKMLTASEINNISAKVKLLRNESREIEAVAMILRQTRPENHRFQVKSLQSKIS
ncbi:hypothetical protein ABH968_001478 [Lysinibacillus sp. RC79]